MFFTTPPRWSWKYLAILHLQSPKKIRSHNCIPITVWGQLHILTTQNTRLLINIITTTTTPLTYCCSSFELRNWRRNRREEKRREEKRREEKRREEKRRDETRRDETRRDETRRDETRRDETRREEKTTDTFVRRGCFYVVFVQRFVEGRQAEVSDPHGETAVYDTIGGTQVAVDLDVWVVDVAHSLGRAEEKGDNHWLYIALGNANG